MIGNRVGESHSVEPVLEPGLPIVDAHHHLWSIPDSALVAMESQTSVTGRALARLFKRQQRYLFDELMSDLSNGHNVRGTVFVDAGAMYRATGPEAMKSVGEVEFVNGVAAMAASALFGEVQSCAGIVGGIDLVLGDAVEDVLRAHIRAGGSRYRGVRGARTAYDEDCSILGRTGLPHLLLDRKFRDGFKWLHQLGLSFDVLLLEPQLPDLIDLARAFPETQIVLNHLGGPVGVGRYEGQREQRFPIWRRNMRILAQCPNVVVKLGGLGNPFGGFKSLSQNWPATSTQLAEEWRPYIETSIEAFGVHRCMFESNFPVDSAAGSYMAIWNAFKRITAGASLDERTALFSATASRVYRLEI